MHACVATAASTNSRCPFKSSSDFPFITRCRKHGAIVQQEWLEINKKYPVSAAAILDTSSASQTECSTLDVGSQTQGPSEDTSRLLPLPIGHREAWALIALVTGGIALQSYQGTHSTTMGYFLMGLMALSGGIISCTQSHLQIIIKAVLLLGAMDVTHTSIFITTSLTTARFVKTLYLD